MAPYSQAMPFTVLKSSKAVADQIDVVGEFPTETEAAEFAAGERGGDAEGAYEFSVESPPVVKDPTLWS